MEMKIKLETGVFVCLFCTFKERKKYSPSN